MPQLDGSPSNGSMHAPFTSLPAYWITKPAGCCPAAPAYPLQTHGFGSLYSPDPTNRALQQLEEYDFRPLVIRRTRRMRYIIRAESVRLAELAVQVGKEVVDTRQPAN